MHADLKTDDLPDLDGEVCVIGAGAAGLTAARRLLDLGHSVVLLESGGTDYEAETSELNDGQSIGQDYYRLEHSRLRFFGGTAAIWGGRVAELDPIDFETRAWVPHSGWPISYAEIRPYYDQAWGLLGLERPAEGANALGPRVKLPSLDQLTLRYWGFDGDADRFGYEAARDLRDHPKCRIVTHATVTEIVTSSDGGRVEELVVKSHGGRERKVRARSFILAAGGIENARLLLASNRSAPAGLGNGRDLVGRYFMEHPHSRGGKVSGGPSWDLLKAFGQSHWVGGQRLAALMTVAEREQERLGILNTSMTVAPRLPENSRPFATMRLYNKAKHDLAPSRLARTLWRGSKSVVVSLQSLTDPARPWLLNRLGVVDLTLLVRAEQAPNPDSRITLAGERDSLGMPRVVLDWRLTDLDKNSVKELVRVFGKECERLGLGKVDAASWLDDPAQIWRSDPLVSAHPIGGYHHMGTTRMANDEKHGVADGYGKMFGVGNLYIAGSSLFPTGGWANPTLTLMALALRTSERVSAALGEPEALAKPKARANR